MQNKEPAADQISLKELIQRTQEVFRFLSSKWIVIALTGIMGSALGLTYAWISKPVYKAVVTFALEDDKQSGGGLSGALGLASSLGFDLGGSAGGAFSGANLIELMRSRKIIQQTLLDSYESNGQKLILADQLLKITSLDKALANKVKTNSHFSFKRELMNDFLHDSIMSELIDIIIRNGVLTVAQKDKKISIITVEVNSIDEVFSKAFAENLVNNVSDFYIETKSRKARINVAILQKQADSVRNELNQAITGVAVISDNTFNLNPALNVNRVPSTKRQVDVQANTAILTQLVTNLELAKVTLLRETPLVQIIDKPVLPLKKTKPRKLKSIIIGGLIGFIFITLFLLIQKFYRQLMS